MAVFGSELDLSTALATFGLSSFRRGQREVIEHIIAGADCLCVMPTGGGKSLCYQLPSLVRPGLTIVVSPLIALMKDQVDSLVKRGIRATLINSSLTLQEQNERLEQVAAGRFSLLYVAPERLRNQRFLDSIRATPIQLLAIDEAHCISEWGHDFRPDYQRLGRFREALGNVQTIALTATATPRVRADILRSLQLDSAETFITGFARDNLYFGSAHCMSDRDKDRQLHEFLQGRTDSGIIYVATRKRCEALVDQLAKEVQLSVGAYHAGLLPEQRKLVQDQFMAGKLKAIVATNAFGMGIDKPDLRYVIHYNMPGTLEAYYQEAGRAGRDGLLSQCVLLFSPQDRYIQEFFIENANPSREVLQSVYDFLLTCDEDPIELTSDEIRENISQSATSEAVNSSLQILSRTGVMERLEVAGGLAMFRLSSRLPTFVDLLPRDANVKRGVLRTVEKAIGDRRDEPVYIHPRWMMEQLKMDRDAMNRHLRELCKLEDFEYVPPFRGRAIHFRKKDVPFDELKIDHAALAARKKADYEKLDQMVAYARSKSCRQRTILEYFGDNSACDCKICDRCQGRSGWPKMPPVAQAPVSQTTVQLATSNQDLRAEQIDAPKLAASNAREKGVTADAEQRPGPSDAASAKSTSNGRDEEVWNQLPTPQQRSAIQLLQTLLGAIERTHGYLSKTVLTQHFSGTASKAVAGLRLQRLPEFGLLKDWKKTHASGLIEAMLEHGLIQQTELKVGKLTVSITDLGLRCKADASAVPPAIGAKIAQALKAIDGSASEPQEPKSKARSVSAGPQTKADGGRGIPSTRESLPKSDTKAESKSEPRSEPLSDAVPRSGLSDESKTTDVPSDARDVEFATSPSNDAIDSVRPLASMPPTDALDAQNAKVDQPIIDDWQWTLRLVRHGYRLGECALIRGKSPDAILADLTVGMQHGQRVAIDQLFDRRTFLAIQEVAKVGVESASPPAALQVFAGLWPFVKEWLNASGRVH